MVQVIPTSRENHVPPTPTPGFFLPSSCSSISKPLDKLSSVSEKQTESWGACAMRFICFFPNLLWSSIKRVISWITCGCLCSEKGEIKAIDELKNIHKLWTSVDSTEKERKNAWDQFCKKFPEVKRDIIEIYLDSESYVQAAPKATDDERAAWIKKCRVDETKKLEQKLNQCDAALLKDLIEKLEEQYS